MTDNEYQCAMCGCVFTKGLSEQEARAEMQQYWPGTPQREQARGAAMSNDTREEYSVDGINWTCDDGDTWAGPFDPSIYPFKRVRDLQQNRVLRFDTMSKATNQLGLPPMGASWWQEYSDLYHETFAIHHRLALRNDGTFTPDEVYHLGLFMGMTSRIKATFGQESTTGTERE